LDNTPDKTIFKYLVEECASKVDSIGINVDRLIEVCRIFGENDRADNLQKAPTKTFNQFWACLAAWRKLKCKRLMFHTLTF